MVFRVGVQGGRKMTLDVDGARVLRDTFPARRLDG